MRGSIKKGISRHCVDGSSTAPVFIRFQSRRDGGLSSCSLQQLCFLNLAFLLLIRELVLFKHMLQVFQVLVQNLVRISAEQFREEPSQHPTPPPVNHAPVYPITSALI